MGDPGDYRGTLEAEYYKAHAEYDRTVVALSAGALGISFAFLKDIVGLGPVPSLPLLFMSWCCWAASLTLTLYSFHTSAATLKRAVADYDSGTLDSRQPGGWTYRATAILNLGSGATFVLGIVLMAVFVLGVLGERSMPSKPSLPQIPFRGVVQRSSNDGSFGVLPLPPPPTKGVAPQGPAQPAAPATPQPSPPQGAVPGSSSPSK